MLSSAATVVASRSAASCARGAKLFGHAGALGVGQRVAAALEHGELVVELGDAVAQPAGVALEAAHGFGERGELAARRLRQRLEQVIGGAAERDLGEQRHAERRALGLLQAERRELGEARAPLALPEGDGARGDAVARGAAGRTRRRARRRRS